MKDPWYVLYTGPRAEKKVAERILASGAECFLPLMKVKKVWSDRIKEVEEVMFPSYLFVRVGVDHLRDLLSIQGVVRAVYFQQKPALVSDAEIMEIRKFIRQAEHHTLAKGEEVQILTGSLKLVSGKVSRIGKTHLYIFIESLGALVCVRKENVSKISR